VLRRVAGVVGAAGDKGGVDTVALDVGDILGIAEYFVITTGTNSRQIRTIVDAVEENMSSTRPDATPRVEGLEESEWVLVDFGDIVVHVFDPGSRDLYDLERLWADAPVVDTGAGAGGVGEDGVEEDADVAATRARL